MSPKLKIIIDDDDNDDELLNKLLKSTVLLNESCHSQIHMKNRSTCTSLNCTIP